MRQKIPSLLKTAAFLFMMCCYVLSVLAGSSGKHLPPAFKSEVSSATLFAPTAAPVISGATSVCEGDVRVYTYPSTPGYTYFWSATNGSSAPSGNTCTVTWGIAGPGTVNIIVKDAMGVVVNTYTLNVTVHAKPHPFITAAFSPTCEPKKDRKEGAVIIPPSPTKNDSCFKACDSTVIRYTAPNNPGSTYTWDAPGSISISASGNVADVYWGAPGNGLIRVTETNMWGCVSSYEKCVKIIPSPKAYFTSTPAAVGGVITICKGQTVYFTDMSNAGAGSPLFNWTWHFGDGGTSPDQNPSHTYTSSTGAGYDTVILYVENECHCKDSFFVLVKVLPATAPIIECLSTVCHNDTATYSTPSGCATAVYHWSVSGGIIVAAPADSSTITVLWGSSGPGTVSLLITGCGSPCPVPTTVTISIISPTATISGADPACLISTGNTYTYSIPVMPGSNYNWTITPAGAGSILNGQGTNIVEVQWNSGPSATLSVTYDNPSLHCGGSAGKVITIRPPFTVTGVSKVCNLSSSIYTATSAVNNAAYSWTVTNSSNVVVASFAGSNVYNVSWTFGPGLYTVTAYNSSGEFCNSPQTFNVNVIAEPPPVTGITGPIKVCTGIPYTYSAVPTSPGYFLTWQAITGSPASSFGPTTSIVWSGGGPYQLKAYQVTMAAPACSSSAFTLNIVNKAPPAPFSVTGPTPTCNNSTRVYTSTLVDPAEDYVWTITPTSAGSVVAGQGTATATVEWTNGTLTATVALKARMCGTYYNATSLSVPFVNPVATIGVTSPICEGTSTTLTAAAGGVSYAWDFGDGTTATTAVNSSPSHIYTSPGTYPVTVTITTLLGCGGTFSAASTIVIKPTPSITVTSADPTVWCPSVTGTVNLSAGATVGSTVDWYKVGTGLIATSTNTYAVAPGAGAPGTYYAIATLNGCTKQSNFINITVNCVPPCLLAPGSAISYTYTQSCMTINFTGSISANGRVLGWYFDDGSGAGATLTTSHTFAEPGYYYVYFTGRFPKAGGPIGDSCDKSDIQVITIPYKPDFGYNILCPLTPTSGYRVQLYDKTKVLAGNFVTMWNWTGTGGTPSSVSGTATPIITYSTAGGTFSVTMTINAGCTITLPVVVPVAPNLTINTTLPVCEGNPVAFSTSASPVTITNYSWTFGDGAGSNLASPIRTYKYSDIPIPAGLANVNLTYIDQYGCSKSTPTYVQTVYQNTVAVSIAPTSSTFCQGGSVVLTATGSSGFGGYTYLWSTTSTSSTITATQSGVYSVEVKDVKGCRARDLIDAIVNVNPLPPAVIFGKTDYCWGETVELTANQGPFPPFTYQWFIGASPSVTGPDFSQALGIGTYNITVKVTNTVTGCSNTSAVFTVIVRGLPSVTASASPVPTCAGSPVTLTASTAALPPYYTWSNGASINPIVVTNAGTYTVFVTDNFGCESAKATTVVHPLPDFSNLMTGCYEFCDTGAVPLVGPYDPGYMYQWYLNGVPIPAGSGGTNRTLMIPVGAVGTYTLTITTVWGCVATSGNVYVTFIHCPPGGCRLDFNIKKIVCLRDSNGVKIYVFQLDIFNPFPSGTPFTLYSTTGTISGVTPATLNAGMNTVTGVYRDAPPYSPIFCVGGTVFFAGRLCTLALQCRDLNSDCPDPQPCNAQGSWKKITCIGKDASGNPQYYFEYSYFWGGSNGSTIVGFNTPNGAISGFSPATVNNGWNTISGILTNSPPFYNPFCFEMYVFDPASSRVCLSKDCIDLPPCETEPCHAQGKFKTLVCIGKDADGNPKYYFEYSFAWGGSNGSSIVSFTSPSGTISGLTPATINTGWNLITGVLTMVPPYIDPFCFEMQVSDPVTGKICLYKDCRDLPPCEIDPCKASGKWKNIVCIGKDADGNPKYYFEYDFGWSGSSGSPIVSFTSPNGTLSSISITSVNNGSNLITGILTMVPPYIDPFCIELTIYDPETDKTCYWKDCKDLPPCEIDPCSADGKFKALACIGKDAAGNPMYYFEYDFGWGGSNGSPILSFTSPNGTLTGLSLSSVNSGSNIISGILTLLPPYTGSFCFEMVVYDPDAGKACFWKDCRDLPDCDIEPCRADGGFKNIVCMGKDADGNLQYYFEYSFGWGGANGSPIVSFTSPSGTISGLSLTSVNSGSNLITGVLTIVPPLVDPFCIEMIVYDPKAGKACYYKDCKGLPDCDDIESCRADGRWNNIICLGRDAHGNPQYYFEYDFGWGGTSGSPIVSFTSPNGTISGVSIGNVNSGSNIISGVITLVDPYAAPFCFEIRVYDPRSRRVCFYKDCKDLPGCDNSGPCKGGEVKIDYIKCAGLDAYGHQLYDFGLSLTNPFGSTSTIYMTSPNGGFSGISPNTIGGSGSIYASFTDLPPAATNPMCFTVIFVDEDGNQCTIDVCADLPVCNDDGYRVTSTTDVSGKSLHSMINLAPNPAKDLTTIHYNFEGHADNTIVITDIYGKVIHKLERLPETGSIEFNTGNLSGGVYTFTGYANGQQVQAKKLVVIK